VAALRSFDWLITGANRTDEPQGTGRQRLVDWLFVFFAGGDLIGKRIAIA